MIADQYLETGLWDLLWTRVNQSLKPNRDYNPQESTTASPNADADMGKQMEQQEPDWMLISPNGLVSVLQLTSRLLTMVVF